MPSSAWRQAATPWANGGGRQFHLPVLMGLAPAELPVVGEPCIRAPFRTVRRAFQRNRARAPHWRYQDHRHLIGLWT